MSDPTASDPTDVADEPAEAPAAGPGTVKVVAIDGPAGSGKSTVGRALAARLGLDYLDTGAMYRGVTFAALRMGMDPADADVVANLARNVDLSVDAGVVVVDGVDATIEIRGPEVTRAVSAVAANAEVRSELVRRQREWAAQRGGGVLEGRDIGTVVFPDAALKVYLTASPEVRAQRRSREVTDLDYETVAADIARRDALDQGRDASPLAQADGAVLVDTSDRGVDAIVDELVALVEAGRPGRAGDASGGSSSADSDESAESEGSSGGPPVSGDASDVAHVPESPSSAGEDVVPSGGVHADGSRGSTSEQSPQQPESGGRRSTAAGQPPAVSTRSEKRMDRARHGHRRPGTPAELRFYAVVRSILLAFARSWLRLTARGTEHVPATGAFILAPVHRSNLDFLLVLITTRRRMRFLAKDSLWKGIWGRIFTALGGIPVARGTADREALRTCIEAIEAGEPLVIFPEGTRQFGPDVHPLFDGPAYVQSRTGVPIIPVGIGGSEAAMPKGSKGIKRQRVRVVVGQPLEATEAESSKARRAAVRARTAELHTVVQDLFDQAQQEAGTPNR